MNNNSIINTDGEEPLISLIPSSFKMNDIASRSEKEAGESAAPSVISSDSCCTDDGSNSEDDDHEPTTSSRRCTTREGLPVDVIPTSGR